MLRKSILIVPVILFGALLGCSASHRPRDKEVQAVRLIGSAMPSDDGNSSPSTKGGAIDTSRITSEMMKSGGARTEIKIDCGSSTDPKVYEARRIIETWLDSERPVSDQRANLADRFEVTAKSLSRLSKSCSQMQVAVETTSHPEIKNIRELLGDEDSTQSTTVNLGGQNVKISNHKFGWLEFFAMDGKVIKLTANFKESGY
jgi:hypothetical protein